MTKGARSSLSRTCLIIGTCCIVALRGFAIRDEVAAATKAREDDFDFEFEHFADNEEEEDEYLARIQQDKEVEKGTKTQRRLEPEAEMLPANYEKVRPPGVDHMEMTRAKKDRPPLLMLDESSGKKLRLTENDDEPLRGFTKET